ncbi:MAG: methyltransferase domain-containing protein [Roseovarius sp.]
MEFKEFARLEVEGWADEVLADTYVTRFSAATDMAVGPMLARLEPGRDLLDLCCGQGNLSAAAHAQGFRVTGLDFSREMLVHAHDRAPDVVFLVGDAQDMPFDDGAFDAVTCGFGLMHVPDQPKALREVARVLRPGGRFVMTSWHGPDVSETFALLYGNVRAHGADSVKMPDSPDFHQFAREDTARGLFDAVGLTLDWFETIDCHWKLDDPAGVADIFQNGAPRASYLLTNQPEENLHAIRQAITSEARTKFAHGDSWTVPMPAALAVATRR